MVPVCACHYYISSDQHWSENSQVLCGDQTLVYSYVFLQLLGDCSVLAEAFYELKNILIEFLHIIE